MRLLSWNGQKKCLSNCFVLRCSEPPLLLLFLHPPPSASRSLRPERWLHNSSVTDFWRCFGRLICPDKHRPFNQRHLAGGRASRLTSYLSHVKRNTAAALLNILQIYMCLTTKCPLSFSAVDVCSCWERGVSMTSSCESLTGVKYPLLYFGFFSSKAKQDGLSVGLSASSEFRLSFGAEIKKCV